MIGRTAAAGALAFAVLFGPAVAARAADLTFAKPHVVLLWEDAGGYSPDVSGLDGPIPARTDKGRSVQMVVDLMLDGEADHVFSVAPVLSVRATGPTGAVLFERDWPIDSVGEFGSVMRSFIVDHGCAPVTVAAELSAAGAVADRFEQRFPIDCS